ncbi:hypothetical protein [Pyrococcus sp. ST04]|uniref:hypothetical protein n=1 Tax=Pyrococcus sp. ST04 TaxID=1183377 RepID=UPI0002605A2A|nr:hypothetical protein [Pyrococcus sp. ST04]AFK21979.1 hypothetical protein Py04_0377 [Pyrococcus sp. ST04]
MRPIFVGIGNYGMKVVWSIKYSKARKLFLNPTLYLFRKELFLKKLEEVFWSIEKEAQIWFIFEPKSVNLEILSHILENSPSDLMKIAYVLIPGRELVLEEKPEWVHYFETVFYDSFWEFLKGREDKPIWQAYLEASASIGEMFTRLYSYLDNQMLVNVDLADFLQIIKGGNVGILRLLKTVDFNWHWGIWERGLINILANSSTSLEDVINILKRFQEILKEKDIIWGVKMDDSIKSTEVLALLVRKW